MWSKYTLSYILYKANMALGTLHPLPLRAVEGGLATSNAVVRGVRIYGRVCSFAVVHIKGGLRQRESVPLKFRRELYYPLPADEESDDTRPRSRPAP